MSSVTVTPGATFTVTPVDTDLFDVTVDPQTTFVTPAREILPVQMFYGMLSRTEPGQVSNVQLGVYQSTGLTGTLGLNRGFIRGVDDELGLRNDTGKTVVVKVYASADVQAGNNHVVGLELALNGTTIPSTECRSHTGVGNAAFAKMVTSAIVEMDPDDEVSLFIANFTEAQTMTVQRCRLIVDLLEIL